MMAVNFVPERVDNDAPEQDAAEPDLRRLPEARALTINISYLKPKSRRSR